MAGNSFRVVLVAFIMNMGIAAAKFIGFFLTGSAAMLAEAVHSVADSSNQVLLFLGITRSTRRASDTHQFGYGMEQYVFSFLVAITIFTVGGAFSLYEGIHKLMHPLDSIAHVYVNVVILLVAVALESYSSYVATKEFKKTKGQYGVFQFMSRSKDQVLVTVLFEDYAALIGLIIAALGTVLYIITGMVIFDSIATILIGVLLLSISGFLYREAKSLLVGEAASPEDQAKIRAVFDAHPEVIRLSELLTMHMSASEILVTAHVKFKDGISLKQVEDIVDELEERIMEEVPEVFKIFIEAHQRSSVEPLQKNPNPPKSH